MTNISEWQTKFAIPILKFPFLSILVYYFALLPIVFWKADRSLMRLI